MIRLYNDCKVNYKGVQKLFKFIGKDINNIDDELIQEEVVSSIYKEMKLQSFHKKVSIIYSCKFRRKKLNDYQMIILEEPVTLNELIKIIDNIDESKIPSSITIHESSTKDNLVINVSY